MSELKRCPFCGGEAKQMFINDEPYGEYVWDESVGDVGTWFKCYKCYTEFFHAEPMDTPEKQAEWWNTRTPMNRIVERLEEEFRLSDSEKHRCIKENPLQFDYAKGYAYGIYNAIKIVKEEGGICE